MFNSSNESDLIYGSDQIDLNWEAFPINILSEPKDLRNSYCSPQKDWNAGFLLKKYSWSKSCLETIPIKKRNKRSIAVFNLLFLYLNSDLEETKINENKKINGKKVANGKTILSGSRKKIVK